MASPLLSFGPHCRLGLLQRREKRFTVVFTLDGQTRLAHTNNSGSMLGLLREGNTILVSKAPGSGRKLPYTLELIRLPAMPEENTASRLPVDAAPEALPPGLWVGVNTLTPNRLLKAAFAAGQLPWAEGYTHFQPEARRGQSRLDALLTGPGLPPLWVECKNVTMVEDGAAAFPDAVTVRGQKHMREMTDIARSGERAAFFYCVQRADARCFGPADYVDADYAGLFYQGLEQGVEAHAHLAPVTAEGIGVGPELPLAPRP